MAPTLPFTRLDPIEVFAVEDNRAQLVWRSLPEGTLSVVVEGREVTLGDAGVPGAAEVSGLRADSSHPIDICVDGRVVAQRTIHTEPSLEGHELVRIATISDLHLGEDGFGLFKPMKERPAPAELHPLRCAKAAVREAVEWGAQLLVIKGDITEDARPEQWALFDELLAETPIPVLAVPGNHDTVGGKGSICATTALRERGLFAAPVLTEDVGGIRIVAVDTTVPTHSWGRMKRSADELCAAVDVATPALIFMHHHIEPQHLPWFWPLGVPRHDGGSAVDRIVGTNPDVLISSGHTHRNRVRRLGSAVLTEVGSTKDHPGVWAGYIVHPSGVRQVVRRVAEPSCLAWTDRTHAAVGGIWGRWSPGALDDRVITHRWIRGTDDTNSPSLVATLEQ